VARTKQKRLTKVKYLPNVFSISDANTKISLKKYFKNDNRFTLEIGCGHGDYSIELAQKYPERNFIGIDVKGARIFQGAIKASELNLKNVAFLITKAERLLEIINDKSVDEIYIPFPDPHFQRAKENRRLISQHFLSVYKPLLTNSGLIHFKTDNQGLFEYGLKTISDFGCKILSSTENLYGSSELINFSNIITSFEKHYIKGGRKIKYICFMFL
jgi:tRNA (guanine-N7-)-methyltransferase